MGAIHYGEYGAAGMDITGMTTVVSVTDQKIIINDGTKDIEYIISYSNDKYLIGIMNHDDTTNSNWGYYDKTAQKFYTTVLYYFGLPDMSKADAYSNDISSSVIPAFETAAGITAANYISRFYSMMGITYDADKITNIRVYGPNKTEHKAIINQYESLFKANGGQGWDSIYASYYDESKEAEYFINCNLFLSSKIMCTYDGVETNVSIGMWS